MSTEVAVQTDVQNINAEYCCPGEEQPISRSVHLGRLARFYAGCLDCPRRHETGQLTRRQDEQLEQWSSRRRDLLTFDGDVVRGGYPNHLGPRQARQIAAALAAHLRDAAGPVTARTIDRPTIMIASDGSAMVADVQAVMTEGLQFAGCDVIDIGLVTAPIMATSIADQSIQGGVLIGSAANPTPQIVLRMFGSGGRPLSVGGSLDDVRRRYEMGVARPCRTAGTLRRDQVTARYLERMGVTFHALRPLRFVLLTPSRILRQFVDKLTADVGCRNLAADEQQKLSPSPSKSCDGDLTDRVVAEQAHFGISIDAAGEACQIVDERGNYVVPHALARHLTLRAEGIRVEEGETAIPSEQRYDQLVANDSDICVTPNGRFWFGDPSPTVDGLQVLARLLTLLSQSDRGLSDVLATPSAKR